MRHWVLLCVMTAGFGCSDKSTPPARGDGSALGGSGGSDDAGAADRNDPCVLPLAQSTACEASFDMQVADNPCDPGMATQATCGRYKVWTSIFVGSDTCVYDTSNNGRLVGARSCGTVSNALPCGNCVTYGIPASQYASCGADTPACPP